MTVERPPAGIDAVSGQRLVMLADDLTGACDAGVQFTLRGASTRVYLHPPDERTAFAGVSVIVTHSRSDASEEASQRVQQACDWIAASGTQLCYKKIDSTLKGNVGAELEAIRKKFPDRLVLVSPAFPKMERILADGWLRVRADEPIDSIHLPSLLTRQGAQRLAHISQPAGTAASDALVERIQQSGADGARIIVIDAVSEAQLHAIAQAAVQIVPQPLLVGSAGLAAAWTELLFEADTHAAGPRRAMEILASSLPEVSPAVSTVCAVVLCIGSKNPVTSAQLLRLAETERVVTFDWEQDDPSHACEALARGDHLAVPLSPGLVNARSLRRLLLAILETSSWRGLFCSGGDTAQLVCATLEVEAIQLCSEILPGLPWGTIVGGLADGHPICTKAGGFGSPDVLCQAVNFLAARPRLRGTQSAV